MTPTIWLGIAALWVASLAAVGLRAYSAGGDAEVAAQAREDRAAAVATAAAASAAAGAISKIKVQNRTIQQEVQREISERVVYRECSHSPEQLQRLNAALTGDRPEPSGRGLVPRAGAAVGPELRGND